MKPKILLLVTLVIAVAALFSLGNMNNDNTALNTSQTTNEGTDDNSKPAPETTDIPAIPGQVATNIDTLTEDDDGFSDAELKPAVEVYKTAEDALTAIKNGAKKYDDLILEQFTSIGDCEWCDKFYGSVKDLLLNATATPDEKSYYAELLAISGRVDNIAFIVDSAKSAKSEAEADQFLEALELSVGKDDVVSYLGTQLDTSKISQNLKESLVAAITNQGSRLSAETLYKHTVANGDPDGYYSLGIGLGELIPEEEAFPFLQEQMLKRDQYSNLAAKSLLNSGLPGLKLVVDAISNSKNPDFDRQMLKDAPDHIAYDEEVESYLKTVIGSSKDEVTLEFVKKVLDDFAADKDE